jgi:hypothetical protein
MIPRMRQTLARIGAGMSVFGMLVWLLWPIDLAFLAQPEPIFGLAVALFVWIATEIKLSEEIQLRESSPNDIRVAKEKILLHQGWLRDLLKDHNTWNYLDCQVYTEVGHLINRFERRELFFGNAAIERLNVLFMKQLKDFYQFISINTSPEMIAGKSMTAFKPFAFVSDDEYKRRENLAKQANQMANSAWDRLDSLVAAIHKEIPEALD